ncbi:hypothetical protein AX14_010656 [Amanita brunnescens Koide BX004]|nr:hypothetical protein AX14_010656 [Amanita brunnescens Koide BX004]
MDSHPHERLGHDHFWLIPVCMVSFLSIFILAFSVLRSCNGYEEFELPQHISNAAPQPAPQNESAAEPPPAYTPQSPPGLTNSSEMVQAPVTTEVTIYPKPPSYEE